MKMRANERALAEIPGLVRCEQYDREAMAAELTELTHTVYPHERLYGEFVTVQTYIDCPPQGVFEYMSNPYSLLEWTYSVRELKPAAAPGLLAGVDSVDTPIYVKTVTCRQALTVDYHCAWDQGEELWMIYLNRIIPAEPVLKRPGSVVVWTNCHHPYYDRNPHPELSRDPKRIWVGDLWPVFYAGHSIELANLRTILETRHRAGLPLGPILEAES
jgi:hypothetical protein